MKKLYTFFWNCGSQGNLEGVFIAQEEEVKNLIGKRIYFGEVLGKHSEMNGIVEKDEIEEKSDDQELIDSLEKVFGSKTICGYNPLDYTE